MAANDALMEKVRALPEQPGVYVYYNAAGKVIYVGKAVNLRRRVASYFNRDHDTLKTSRILILAASTDDRKYG